MNTFILCLGLSILLIYIVFIKRISIIGPAVLFISMFFLNALFYLMCVPSLPDISMNTALLVLTDCVVFYFFSELKIKIKSRRSRITQRKVSEMTKERAYIKVPNYKLLFFLIFSGLSLIIYFQSVKNVVSMAGMGINSIASIMVGYTELAKFTTENVSLPIYAKLFEEVVYLGGIVLGFIQINNYFAKGKKSISPIIICTIVISVLISLITGSRSDAVKLIIALAVIFLAYTLVYSTKAKARKSITKVGGLFLLIILSFKMVGNLMGRGNTRTLIDTLLMYIGGPLKCLDLSITKELLTSDLPGQLTFAYQYRNIANIFGYSNLIYDTSLPFQVLNGRDLGNVYTAIAVLVVDFGVVVSVFLIAFMGWVCGLLFRKFKESIVMDAKPMWILIYSSLTYHIIMDGFSEKFYGFVLSPMFIRNIIWFYLLIKFFTKKYERVFS